MRFVSMTIYQLHPSLLKGKSAFELLHGQALPYSQVKNFGCSAFAHDHNLSKDILSARSRPCVFMGYPFGKKWWHSFNLQDMKFII